MILLDESRPLPRVERQASGAYDQGVPELFQEASGDALFNVEGVEVRQCGNGGGKC